MKLKHLLCSALSACMLLGSAYAVDLYVDHQKLSPDAPPTIVNGRTLVPLRSIFEALNADVQWDAATATASASKADTTVSIQIGSTTAAVNGASQTLDVPAQIIGNRTFVPARFVSEALHADVSWDAVTQTVYITTDTAGILKIYYLDVGQADSILLISDSEAMLIDAGTNAAGSQVVSDLQKYGVNHLNYAVGTHPHEDHIGGLDDVIHTYPVDHVLMPGVTTTTNTFSDVLDAIEANNVALSVPNAGDHYQLGDANVTVMNTLKTDDRNNASLVLRVTHGSNHFLFTGDAESESEQDMLASGADLSSDVLKVGHHGSRTSTSDPFLQAVRPKDAIISCGSNNSYGHPHAETLAKLSGCNIWRTDLHGTIKLVSNGSSYTISAEKNTAPPSKPVVPAPPVISPTPPEVSPAPPVVSHKIYVTKTGKRYHYNPNCNNGTYYESTLADARSRGLTPCSKCVR